ncbi:MAG: AMP-binding protein [Desulfobacterales bacterium]|nr:AMP-binding protein [Desulfobacteraceae bacterium]MBT7697065.1 AMP-binding protein [Desulfobacterales bacterium]
MNLPELFESSVKRLGERRVMVFEGRDYTNIELLDIGKRLHSGLKNLGVGKGDNVVMCLINDPMVYPVFQGIFRNGAAAIPVMFALTSPEMKFILSDCKAKGVITDAFSIDRVREAVKDLEHIKWIAIRGGEDNLSGLIPEYSMQGLMENDPEEELPSISEQDLAMMLYTSGTTGKPKGVMLTHESLFFCSRVAMEAAELDRWDSPQISIATLPLAHIFGVMVMLADSLIPERLRDGYMVLMAWFEPEKYMQLIQEHKANQLAVVPTMLAFILNHPKVSEYDLTSIHEVTSGGAALPLEQDKAFSKLAGLDSVRQIYGNTECCGLATSTRKSESHPPGSVGKVYPEMELAIFDGDENPLPAFEKGEIVVKGPAVMKGYLNRPEATTETIVDGWLHTGDVGYLDEKGFLFITDRKKDMIIRGGENIYPCELEEVMYQHPAVAEAAVVGTPDPVYGENVIGFVVLKQGEKATAEDIIEFMKTSISKFKVPSEINFLDALPKSSVGKILKRELREQKIK